jgi:hypothetical protein
VFGGMAWARRSAFRSAAIREQIAHGHASAPILIDMSTPCASCRFVEHVGLQVGRERLFDAPSTAQPRMEIPNVEDSYFVSVVQQRVLL